MYYGIQQSEFIHLVNVIGQLVFDFIFYEAAVEHFNNYVRADQQKRNCAEIFKKTNKIDVHVIYLTVSKTTH